MRAGDSYRRMAAELRAKAKAQSTATLALEMEHLALCYLRLAQQADDNSQQDVWFEVGSKTRLDGEGDGT
jgi:hypothetical protein